MHDADLKVDDEDTIPDAPRRYRRRRRAFDVSPFRRLFHLLARLRASSPDALDELFFKRAYPKQSKRNNRRMIANLVDNGWLAKMRLPYARLIYHLTRKSLATFASDGVAVSETLRRAPSEEIGGYLWLRSSMHAELAREGFTVGRGPAEVLALRRFLLDTKKLRPAVAEAIRADKALTPPVIVTCRRIRPADPVIPPAGSAS